MSALSQGPVGNRDMDRFWLKVDLGDWDACWPWKASRHPDGYGQFVLAGRPVGAHRVAYGIVQDRWPEGIRISHHCGNLSCVNPAHLSPATATRQRRSRSTATRPIEVANVDEDRFWSKVDVGDWDACWHWKAAKLTGGYGSFWLSGHNVGAHRVAFTLVHGPIPHELCICHHCDNPPCVNPAHLFPGTHEDNQADKVRKKRHARGLNHGAARLSFDIVEEIRALAASSTKQTVLAARFGVSRSAIHAIVTHQNWRSS